MMRTLTFILTFFALTAMVGAGPAQAASLGELRASGAIGERHDGFTMVRNNAPGAAEVVATVNAQRRNIYQTRAAQQKTSVAAVGAVYASQIFANAAPGTWFLTADGAWRQK
ncbi:MAG: hypothetical protein ACI9JL_000404 [Paracoccaceae bacterium]|jgi:uncharacterized protein YdbL (DUF1318 family)